MMNTKGPSASGKSTLRPLQHALADRIGADWRDFALISPDIWRKQLIDYASLGADHRYGGMLTAEELAIIDRKLDRYVEAKAEQGRMTHLLIDRFRFGSFLFQSERTGDQLLSRFGQVVYFFLHDHAADALVERAWKRGLELGRYKAVDDILAHSIEAYSGMPHLFLTWARRNRQDGPLRIPRQTASSWGQAPRTVAFGWNGQVFVLDVKCMMDVVRYRKVNVDATAPAQLFSDAGEQAMKPEHSTEFLLAMRASTARGDFRRPGDRAPLSPDRGGSPHLGRHRRDGCGRIRAAHARRRAGSGPGRAGPQRLAPAGPAVRVRPVAARSDPHAWAAGAASGLLDPRGAGTVCPTHRHRR